MCMQWPQNGQLSPGKNILIYFYYDFVPKSRAQNHQNVNQMCVETSNSNPFGQFAHVIYKCI